MTSENSEIIGNNPAFGLFSEGPVVLCSFALDDAWSLLQMPESLGDKLGFTDEHGRLGLAQLLGHRDYKRVASLIKKARENEACVIDLPPLQLRGADGGTIAVSGRFQLSEATDIDKEPHMVGYFVNRVEMRDAHIEDQQKCTHTDEEGEVESELDCFLSDPIHQLLLYDLATGLPNQSYIAARLDEWCEKTASDKETKTALHMVGFNNFENTLHSMGFEAGDDLLREISARLKNLEGELALLGRLNGDRFVLLQEIPDGMGSAAALTEKILSLFSEPIYIDNTEVFLYPAIGLAICPDHVGTGEHLLRCSGLALDEARKNGQGAIQMYNEDLQSNVQRQIGLIRGMHRAFLNDEFSVKWQPKIDLQEGHITGAEALIRWKQNDGTRVSPVEFIPIAESTGLIGQITGFMLKQVCFQLREWLDKGLLDFKATVNISAMDFANHEIINVIDEALEESGLPSEYLGLEVTEGALLNDVEVTRSILKILSNRGIEVSIDDFGTGYCSLSYLGALPIDILKIDRSFIMDLPNDKNNLAITRSIIDLAHNLDMKVVAEGVGTNCHVEFLREEGCDQGQGFHFLRPMDTTNFTAWLAQHKMFTATPETHYAMH